MLAGSAYRSRMTCEAANRLAVPPLADRWPRPGDFMQLVRLRHRDGRKGYLWVQGKPRNAVNVRVASLMTVSVPPSAESVPVAVPNNVPFIFRAAAA
jgi:hypothetical protein